MADQFSTRVYDGLEGPVIAVMGTIDIATAERLRDAVEPHLAPRQVIVLDLSGVEFMDSACLHVLERARSTLTADGGSLMLRNPSRAARRLLALTDLHHLVLDEADRRVSN